MFSKKNKIIKPCETYQQIDTTHKINIHQH